MKIQSILPHVVVGSDDVSRIDTLLSCNFYHIKEEYLKNTWFDKKAYKKLNEAIVITEYNNAIDLVSSYNTFGKNVIDFPIKLDDDVRLTFVEHIYKVYGLELIFLDVLITRDLIKHLEKQNNNLVHEYCNKYRYFINSEWHDEHNRLYNKIDKSWGLLDYLLTDYIKNINSDTVEFYNDVINVIATSNIFLGDISRLFERTVVDYYNLSYVIGISLRIVDTDDVFKIINYIFDNYILNRHKDDTVYIRAQSIIICILFSLCKVAKTKDDIKNIFDKYDDYFSLLAKEDNSNIHKYDDYLKLYMLAIKSFVFDDIESVLQYKNRLYELSKKFLNFGVVNTFHMIYIFYICKEYTNLIKDSITMQYEYIDGVDTFLEKSYKQIYKKCILKGYIK